MNESVLREIARLRSRSKNVRFEELRRLRVRAGGDVLTPTRGSHFKFVLGSVSVPVPYHRPHVQRPYVVEVLKALEEHFAD